MKNTAQASVQPESDSSNKSVYRIATYSVTPELLTPVQRFPPELLQLLTPALCRHLSIYIHELANMGVPAKTFCIGVAVAGQALPQFFVRHGNLQLRGELLVVERLMLERAFAADLPYT
jgi:hypothetical protein